MMMKETENGLQPDKKEWNDFVVAAGADGGFLQSWQWGEFQQEIGREIFRVSVGEDKAGTGEKISAVALVIKHSLPLGQNYLYVPRGPVVSDSDFAEIISEIKKLGVSNHSLFVRIDPAWKDDRGLKSYGFNFVGQVQPKKTLMLDLNWDETDLLAAMKPKTRYNIKIAQKHGIVIKEAKEEEFELFWELMVKTCARDGIKSHPKGYYQKQLKIPGFKLVLAWWQNKAIAGAIIGDFSDTRTYVHGASDYEFRDKMAPYLLQWEMIREARKLGLNHYDFWGADQSNLKWAGVTRFKIGFAPQRALTEYIGAYDLALRPIAYRLYKLFRK